MSCVDSLRARPCSICLASTAPTLSATLATNLRFTSVKISSSWRDRSRSVRALPIVSAISARSKSRSVPSDSMVISGRFMRSCSRADPHSKRGFFSLGVLAKRLSSRSSSNEIFCIINMLFLGVCQVGAEFEKRGARRGAVGALRES